MHLSLRLLNFSEPIDGLRTVTLDSFGKLFRVLLWRLPPDPLHVRLRGHGYMTPEKLDSAAVQMELRRVGVYRFVDSGCRAARRR